MIQNIDETGKAKNTAMTPTLTGLQMYVYAQPADHALQAGIETEMVVEAVLSEPVSGLFPCFPGKEQ